jgi:serine/threonine protein kinase
MHAKDQYGRFASQMAREGIKNAMMEVFLWFGQYRVLDQRPIHQSATCYIYKAIDERADESGVVALKLMRVKSQFIREISTRHANFDPELVMSIIRTYPTLKNVDDVGEVSEDSRIIRGHISKPIAESMHCIVFPYADRNLFVALKQERFSDAEMKFNFLQNLKGVRHLYEKGILHGDIKPLNIMRDGIKWKLIDLDAACRLNVDHIGSKSSTAYMPPEAVYTSKNLGIGCIRSLSNQPSYREQLQFELLIADPSFDLWSRGCILYHFCHPQRQALFLANQDDNLSLEDEGYHDSIWALGRWNRNMMLKKLQAIKDDKARNLISRMLHRAPSNRPSLSSIETHP